MDKYISKHNPTGMWGEVALLTPDLAKSFLSRNHGNRPVSLRTVNYLSAAVVGGRWRLNGEAIRFDEDGYMRDGQHRCQMVRETGIAVPTFIIREVPNDAFPTFDKGRKRGNSDVLHIVGEPGCILLAASLAWVWRWENGIMNTLDAPCPEDCLAVLAVHGGIREFMCGTSRQLKTIMPGCMAVAMRYITSLLDKDRAERFWESVASGENLHRGMAEYALRMRLVADKASKARLPRRELVALCIKAWNARDTGVGSLRWRREGKKPEAFPELQ